MENKYLMLVPTDESKDTLKTYKELWTKIRDLIRSKCNNSEYYHEKCMKIKLNSDDDLALKKALELHSMTIVVRAVFQEDNKF